ncbi:MAG TPA: hypothetical protein DIW82_07400 [Corynebacterium nuruki]|jgi:hypothetical protein|uniref:Type II toxin-antitoxin system PemK/MazF family toxin n=2 Tax=Corynebacterium nuruki TaxID=1032851 RepID=A0A3D4SZ94_9CORY|nr:hypothetical protein [Corynebacterium nuruki]
MAHMPETVTGSSPRTGNLLTRFIQRHFHHRGQLETGLDELHANLGLSAHVARERTPEPVTVTTPSALLARPVIYAPDMDGQADPGEVIWYRIKRSKDTAPELRACLVVGRHNHTLLGLLISSNPEHAEDNNWILIGTGLWDPKGNPCWARVDRVVEIQESRIQRRGVSMPERRYDRIATVLRSEYGWV